MTRRYTIAEAVDRPVVEINGREMTLRDITKRDQIRARFLLRAQVNTEEEALAREHEIVAMFLPEVGLEEFGALTSAQYARLMTIVIAELNGVTPEDLEARREKNAHPGPEKAPGN